MRIFESSYFIIVLIVSFLLLISLGLYFAVRGLKTVNDEEGTDFTSISKLESKFAKSGKMRENRSLMYISISLDNYRSLYSEQKTGKLYSAIKKILLQSFAEKNDGLISTYGDHTFVVYSSKDMETVRQNMKDFNTALTKCLMDSSALNIVQVNIGLFFFCSTSGKSRKSNSYAQNCCCKSFNHC